MLFISVATLFLKLERFIVIHPTIPKGLYKVDPYFLQFRGSYVEVKNNSIIFYNNFI
jgi:hypothetical protein